MTSQPVAKTASREVESRIDLADRTVADDQNRRHSTADTPGAKMRSAFVGWWRRNGSGVGAVAAGTAAIAVHAQWYGRWIIDDAAITFAYARNVAQGHGPVAQAGVDPVEGFSNPAWLLVLAIGRWIGLFDRGTIFGFSDLVIFPKAVALLCCIGILCCAHLLANRLLGRRAWIATLVTGMLLAANPSFVIWSFSGLENPLYALTVTVLATLLATAALDDRLLDHRTAIAAGLLAALAALTRPDGAIYAGAFPILVLVLIRTGRARRTLVMITVSIATFVAPYGSYLVWRHATFDRLVPNTAVAKAAAVPTLPKLADSGLLLQYLGWLAVLLATVVVGVALVSSSRLRPAMAGLLVPTSLALVAYGVLNADWMPQHRFGTPIWPLTAIITALAVLPALNVLTSRARAAMAVTAAMAAIMSGSYWYDAAKQFREQPTVPMCFVADRFGRVYNIYADRLGVRNGTLALQDVGGTLLTTRLQVVDTAGLVDRRIADAYGNQSTQQIADYLFDEVRPTFLHFHGALRFLAADPRFGRDYITLVDPTDYVRRDVVPAGVDTEALRWWATQQAKAAEAPNRHSRRDCGAQLTPGQTLPQ